MKFEIPHTFTKQHGQALTAYLSDSGLTPAVWRQLYEAINLLNEARIITDDGSYTFRQVYNQRIDQKFATEYLKQLLDTDDVIKDSPRLTAFYARQIKPILESAELLQRRKPESWLLLIYCIYWWQSFARGYAFEVEIWRDLSLSGIEFHMHDILSQVERYSPADLVVLGLMGDIKTSTYFLQTDDSGRLPNDFYVTRLYDQERERTLVVFQKPVAWEVIDGGETTVGELEDVSALLPKPVQLERHGIILIVVEYETWKQLVRRKQAK